jgi:hypothetical protein
LERETRETGIPDRNNESLKKECGHGVSPAKFKEFMLEFGFTDALNRKKLEVPTPSEPTPKSRLCNIFTNRVLRKLGIETQETPPKETTSLNLEDLKTVNWSDMFYDEHECCLCGYQKLTCWEAETFKGDKLWICEDCKQEWEKQRNNID